MRPSVVLILALAALCAPGAVGAQERAHRRVEVPGLDFSRDGVWRRQARAVRAARARLLAAGRFGELNAPVASGALMPSAAALSGTLQVPVVLFTYAGTSPPAFTPVDYNDVLFSLSPPLGRPYTYRTFYREMSNNLLDIQGTAAGWTTLSQAEGAYNGGTSSTCAQNNPFGTSNCNGVWSPAAFSALQAGLREATALIDDQVDFSQFSYDTATGIVSLVLLVHATAGGECGGSNHVWAHRSSFSPAYVTSDPWPGHGAQKLKVQDYILQSGLGGVVDGCNAPSQIMPIGIVAHETGHGFGLPDLYDTGGLTSGIGRWGLMSAGNYDSPASPARMEAWSLNELGWVTLVTADTTGTYSFGAAPTADTAFFIRPQGTNPRGEYFLLENRQATLSDTALIRRACQVWYQAPSPSPCAGGLLVWHVDSQQVANGGITNDVNNGAIHGLALVQADGRGNLDANPAIICTPPAPGCSDRGDLGDPYPGKTSNAAFSFNTNPAAVKTLDGSFVGFAIDSIRQVVPGGEMAFRLRFGGLTVVQASDVGAVISVDGTDYTIFRDLFEEGSSHTVSFADSQVSSDGGTRWRFLSWSDGGAKTHPITGTLAGATFIASLNRDFKLIATAGPGGTISANPSVNLAGEFIAEGNAVRLTATPDSGVFFGSWTGDTASNNPVLTLPMGRPYTVAASFAAQLAISSGATRPPGVMGGSYADTLRVTGGTGTNSWTVTGGALPQGVTLDAASGVLFGFPRQTGSFSYTATVVSGAQTRSQPFTFSVSAPALVTADIVTQILGPPGAPLTPDQLRYLDYLGNNNGSFDVGDFLAWVKATGAP